LGDIDGYCLPWCLYFFIFYSNNFLHEPNKIFVNLLNSILNSEYTNNEIIRNFANYLQGLKIKYMYDKNNGIKYLFDHKDDPNNFLKWINMLYWKF